MKVAHINSYFFTNRLHEELVKHLDSGLGQQLVWIPGMEKGRTENLERLNSTYHAKFISWKFGQTLLQRNWLFRIAATYRKISQAVKKDKPDFIHAHTTVTNGIIAYLLFRKYSIPYMVTVRNTDANKFLLRTPFMKPIIKRVFDLASSIIFLSPSYWQVNFKQTYGQNDLNRWQSKVQVIPNGIAPYWLENKNLTRNKSLTNSVELLFVGDLNHNKNIRGLLDALKLLNEQGHAEFKLVVVGNGPLESELRSSYLDLPIEWLGKIGDVDRLRDIYRSAQICVIPSHTEAFGLVYAEALSQGCPVVFTKNQGFDHIFPENSIGVAVDSRDSQSIAEGVLKVKSNYASFISNIKSTELPFDWREIAQTYLELYDSTK